MTDSRIIEAGREFVSAIDDAGASPASDAEMIDALRDYGTIHDRSEAAAVLHVGRMIRRGVFTAHGYTRPEYAIADLLGWDRRPARRRVKLAEQVCPRISLDGQLLPALLPATATVFAEGRLTVAAAEAIVAVLNSPAATRLHPDTWAGVEEQVAHYAATTRATPNDVAGWAKQLVEAYDQDGAEPDDEPEQVNELRLSANPAAPAAGSAASWTVPPTKRSAPRSAPCLPSARTSSEPLNSVRPTRWVRSAGSRCATTTPCPTPAANAPRSGSPSTSRNSATRSQARTWIPAPGTRPRSYGCWHVTARSSPASSTPTPNHSTSAEPPAPSPPASAAPSPSEIADAHIPAATNRRRVAMCTIAPNGSTEETPPSTTAPCSAKDTI
jgi:hypothetical protein